MQISNLNNLHKIHFCRHLDKATIIFEIDQLMIYMIELTTFVQNLVSLNYRLEWAVLKASKQHRIKYRLGSSSISKKESKQLRTV